jgi:hypothetical protein
VIAPAPHAIARRRLRPEWALIGFLWCCYTLNHADRQVVYTLFPALQKEFGYSDAVVGLTGALFLWVYGRKPSPAQMKLALADIADNVSNKKAAYENILWALINTKEYYFNH